MGNSTLFQPIKVKVKVKDLYQKLRTNGIKLENEYQPKTLIMNKLGNKEASEFNVFAKMDCKCPTYFAYQGNDPKIYTLKRLDPNEPSISELSNPVNITDEETKTTSVAILEKLKKGTDTKPITIYNPQQLSLEVGKTVKKREHKPDKIEIIYDNYLVYPFVEGVRLDSYCKNLKPEDKPFETIIKLMLNVCDTLSELEKFNSLLSNHNKKLYLLEGVWDINERNMIVQKNNSIVLIDYQAMKINPHDEFLFLIQQCFALHAKVDLSLPDADKLEGLNRFAKILNMSDQNKNVLFPDKEEIKHEFIKLLKNFSDLVKSSPTGHKPSFALFHDNLEKFVNKYFSDVKELDLDKLRLD